MKTLNSYRRILLIVSIIFLGVFPSLGQTNEPTDKWVRVENDARDFSISFPSNDFLVLKGSDEIRLWYRQTGFAIDLLFEKDAGAKKHVSSWSYVSDPKSKSFTSGNFIGLMNTFFSDETGRQTTTFQFASSEGKYTITARFHTSQFELADRFFRSLRLDGNQIVDTSIVESPATTVISLKGLATSERIKLALKQPDNQKVEVVNKLAAAVSDTGIYSRDLILVEKPTASYTSEARENNVQGSVTLEVTFLANGTLGPIRVITSLPKGLDRMAIKAASKVKFIPAEIDGKPVDSTGRLRYGFAIY